ncbi:Alpha/Beta hydrolase protein [Armillaria novae-zelandiae]|uniref:Dipeptidyl-peptidase V n=1 Tax=Armillaria novae-zelandiae TaxID=153914 RepID=A0AA39NRK3_9AGAR|nr:Alpha/Beta hydrolase protein [Armillaria novae-zelandiae]
MFHTPSQIASSQKVRDISISPDGERVLYQVQQFYKSSDRVLAELWLARTGVADSARQLTNGDFHDRAGVFHPFDSNMVIFLSDRWNPGKGGNIHSLRLTEDEMPTPLAVEPMKKGIQQFQISPDGKCIAFTAACDGPVRGDSSDARRMGDKRGLSHLFLLNPITGEISSMVRIRKDRHIESFTWSPDSKELLYRLREDRGPEAAEREVLLERISVVSQDAPVTIDAYPRSPSGSNIWLSSDHILTLQSYDAASILGARTLYVREGTDKGALVRKLYGETEDAIRIIDMTNHSEGTSNGMIAVEIASDIDTRIDGISFPTSKNDEYEIHSLFRTQDEAIWFGAWDAKRVRSATGVSYVFAAVLSSGIRHEAPNVWSVRVDDNERCGEGSLLGPGIRTQLSFHLQWLVEAPQIKTEVIRWKSKDGVELSGLVRYPPNIDQKRVCALPTILFLHGGPYRRDVPDYMPYFCNWREMLASAGYLVISPNYRGSQGRGHAFAHAAACGIGAFDWPDCQSMVHEVVTRGLADPDRLGVAGWSHGGSLAAWGVTQTKTVFKAAIVGAGVSNWESMVMEAASPELEGALGGLSPWNGWMNKTSRKESPVQRVAGVTTAVLILHGEKDERVPLAQGIGLYRSLKRTEGPCKDRVEMVVYPREPHG